VRRRFRAAWDGALRGQPPPDLDAFLNLVPEPERPGLREELAAVDRAYRLHAHGSGDTALPAGDHTAPPRRTLPDEADADVPADERATLLKEGGTAADAPAPPVMPAAVAGHEILGVLGRGSMGVVYQARQRGLNRVVALKMILAGAHAGEYDLGRFRAEAETLARIRHANIVQIYEVGEEDGRPYFALEYVDGGTLAARSNGVPQPPREAARLVGLLAAAMDAAHRAGVVHRDLKPANVLLTADGTPKITDFGVAKRLEGGLDQTHSGSVLGSPGYMSPEQAEGRNRDVGPAADVYALGAILYELLTGRTPFRAPTLLATLELIRTREPVAPSELQPGVPRDLETVCLRCLQKDPRKRYASAGALAEDLRRFLNREPILARPVGRAERAWRWCRRNPRLALMGAAVAALVVAWAVSMSVLAWQLKLQKDQADANYALAVKKTEEAARSAALARVKEKEAERHAAEARRNLARAHNSVTVALQRITNMSSRIQQKMTSRAFNADATPGLRALRADVLNQLREGMLGMARDLYGAADAPFATVALHQQMGDLLKRLGRGKEALWHVRQGVAGAEKVARAHPDDDKGRANLCVMLKRLGDLELELNGDAAAARDAYARALALGQDIIDHPRSHFYTDADHKRLQSHYEVGLGQAYLGLGDAAAALGHFTRALALRQAWSKLQPQRADARSFVAEAHYCRALALCRRADAKGARAAFDEATRICRELAGRYPKEISFKADVAGVIGALGEAQLRGGQVADAERNCRAAIEGVRTALRHDPDNVTYQMLRARAEGRLAAVAVARGDTAAARKGCQEALRLWQALREIDPDNRTWRAAAMLALARCGQEAEAVKTAGELCRNHPKSVPLLLDAARCYAVLAGRSADAAAKQRLTEQAVAALRAAAAAGCKGAADWHTDPDLAPLRGAASYQALLAELAKR
jgi:serine/threonine-protein kinase